MLYYLLTYLLHGGSGGIRLANKKGNPPQGYLQLDRNGKQSHAAATTATRNPQFTRSREVENVQKSLD